MNTMLWVCVSGRSGGFLPLYSPLPSPPHYQVESEIYRSVVLSAYDF